MDPQADVTFALLAERPPEASGGYLPPSAHALLIGHYTLEQVILPVPRYPNLSLIPANADLADASLRLARHPTRLKRLLLDLPESAFDVVLIDTGKGLDPLAINALAAADEVIVILTPGRLELDAIARMQEHVALVRDEVLLQSKTPVIRGILLTLADPYSITRDTLMRLHSRFPDLMLKTVIPKNNDLQKAIGRARSVFRDCPAEQGSRRLSSLDRGVGPMNANPPTGLGEPEPAGMRVLFQPPVAENRPEEHKSPEDDPREPTPAIPEKKHPEARPARRVRTTITLTSQAFEVIQGIQQVHRLKTGKVLPLWQAVSQAIEHYGRSKRQGRMRKTPPAAINDIRRCLVDARTLARRIHHIRRSDLGFYRAFTSLAGDPTTGLLAYLIWRSRAQHLRLEHDPSDPV